MFTADALLVISLTYENSSHNLFSVDWCSLSLHRKAFFCRRSASVSVHWSGAIGVRANIHLGGQTEFCPNGFSGGGGGSSRNFPGSIFCGVAHFFPFTAVTDPKFVFFFQLTAVTDPKFVFLKHVLRFARIMSTLCPNSCRQTARIGGATAPPAPPSRTPMSGANQDGA